MADKAKVGDAQWAKFGLCTAYFASTQAHPTNLDAVAFKNLIAAAAHAGQTVAEFCSTTSTTDTSTNDTTSTATTGGSGTTDATSAIDSSSAA